MSFVNPAIRGMKERIKNNNQEKTNEIKNDIYNKQIENNNEEILIDINDIMNTQEETKNVVVDKEDITIPFGSAKITGIPRQISMSYIKLGEIISLYERNIPDVKKIS